MAGLCTFAFVSCCPGTIQEEHKLKKLTSGGRQPLSLFIARQQLLSWKNIEWHISVAATFYHEVRNIINVVL